MLAVLLVGQFMGLVDVFVVNVAMPEIGVDLQGAAAALSETGYWLALLSVIGAVAGITLSRTVLRAKRVAVQEGEVIAPGTR
jgi:MFS family permease